MLRKKKRFWFGTQWYEHGVNVIGNGRESGRQDWLALPVGQKAACKNGGFYLVGKQK
jgi:hypothetical protein